MRSLRSGRPLWIDQSLPKRQYPQQRGDLAVDVVIVGGGIAGAICAYLFADAGVRVALLESQRVARGSTLASTALLMQEPDRDFGDLARRFGRPATREGVVVRASHGTVAASCIVVATGYATAGFRGLAGRFKMKDTYVLSTRRLRAQRHGVMAWDTERPYHFLRWTDDGRLLVGGEDTVHRAAKGSRQRIARARERLATYLARIYPDLADEKFEYAWEGVFAETPDGLPYIGEHSRYPKHLFALGYGGNGMTASFLAAKTLVAMYQRRDTANLFAFDRARR